jgi:hypothetical protein
MGFESMGVGNRIRAGAAMISNPILAAALMIATTPIDKGAPHGTCNRGACDTSPATWWNPHMRMHYCCDCAQKLNDVFKSHDMQLCEQIAPSIKP